MGSILLINIDAKTVAAVLGNKITSYILKGEGFLLPSRGRGIKHFFHHPYVVFINANITINAIPLRLVRLNNYTTQTQEEVRRARDTLSIVIAPVTRSP